MTRRVVMSKPVLEAAPEYTKQEARLRFEEIAEGVGGTVENFVSMMNARAPKIGLKQSHFVNPMGWINRRVS